MENKNKKIVEFLKNAELIQYSDSINRNLFHYSFRDSTNKIYGTGSDSNKEVAILKSISEFAERTVYSILSTDQKEKPLTSNGFAAHTTLEKAKEAALNEAIERDAFLSSWLVKRAPRWIKENDPNFPLSIIGLQKDIFLKKSFAIDFGIIGYSKDKTICVGALTPVADQNFDFGCIISAACDRSVEESISKIAHDLSRAGTSLLHKRDNGEKLFKNSNELDFLEFKDTYDHINYYLNPQNREKLDWFLNHSNNEILQIPEFTFSFKEFFLEEFFSYPLFVANCESDDFQNYFVGKTERNKINHKRLNTIFNSSYTLNFQIHPLG